MSSSMSQSISSSYLESPTSAAPIGGYSRSNFSALDENHASESDSDAESFAEEFSYVPTLESLASPAILGASGASSKSSKTSRSRSRHGSMETAASSRLSCVSTTSSTVSMGVNDSGYFGSSSHSININDPSASSLSVGTLHGSTSSSINGRSVGSSRTPKIKKKRPEWRRRTDTIQETQPTDLINAPPHTFVESSPNGTPFIVNI
eukprot:jgi/Phyca11/504497/fgenesh2_kg.PHYCAscaffold_8_\